MQRYYMKREQGLGGVSGDSRRARGSGAFWKRVIENSQGCESGDRLLRRHGPSLQAVDGRGDGVELRFGVEESGRGTTEWRAETVEMLSLQSGSKSIWAIEGLEGPEAEAGKVVLPMAAEETVCRLRVEFSKVAGFEESELWRPQPLSLPRRGGALAMPAVAAQVDGATVRLHSLTAPGGIVPGEFRELWNRWTGDSSVFTLWVEVSPEGTDRRLTLVSAVDELGRTADVRSGLWSGEHYAFGLVPPAGASVLSLTFALHRSWVEELVVDTRSAKSMNGQQN
jgi:hypothetical protein